MNSELYNKITSLATSPEAAQELREIFETLEHQKKQAEEHLTLLESAISDDYDSIVITDLELESPGPHIVYVNDGFTKLTGFTKEEAIGKTPRILQGPKTDRETLDSLVRELKEGKSFFGQAVNYRKDGSEFINQWDIHPLYNNKGEITHWVSYQHDVTKRKQSEITFNETEIEFDKLIEYSKRILIDVNTSGIISQANKAFRTLTGFENTDLTDKPFAHLVNGDDKNTIKKILGEVNTSGEKKHYELTLLTKNKLPIQVEIDAEYHPLQSSDLIRLTVQNVSMQKKVLKTLKEHFFNVGALINIKSEFSFAMELGDDNNPVVIYLSDGFEQLTGYNRGIFLKSGRWNDLINETDRAVVNHHYEKIKKGSDAIDGFAIKHKNNTLIPILCYAHYDNINVESGKHRITGTIVRVHEHENA